MLRYTTYIVFEPSTNGSYGVYWPDLPGCVSMGDDLQHAERMAAEALGLHIYEMEHDGDVLPPVAIPPFEEMPDGGIVTPITIQRYSLYFVFFQNLILTSLRYQYFVCARFGC